MKTDSFSLYAYNPLFGRRRLGVFCNGGEFDSGYFDRNQYSFLIVMDRLSDLIRDRYADKSVRVSWDTRHFERDGVFKIRVSVETLNISYACAYDVLVFCPSVSKFKI